MGRFVVHASSTASGLLDYAAEVAAAASVMIRGGIHDHRNVEIPSEWHVTSLYRFIVWKFLKQAPKLSVTPTLHRASVQYDISFWSDV